MNHFELSVVVGSEWYPQSVGLEDNTLAEGAVKNTTLFSGVQCLLLLHKTTQQATVRNIIIVVLLRRGDQTQFLEKKNIGTVSA